MSLLTKCTDIAKAMVSIAIIFISLNQAFAQHQRLDSLVEELQKLSKGDSSKVKLLNSIGYGYWIVDANASIHFGMEALQLSQQLSYEKGAAKASRVIGVAYWSQGFQNNALKYLKSSLELYNSLGDKSGISNTTLNLGMVYADLKSYDKAMQCYESAINGFTALGLKGRIATTFTKIGTMLIEQQRAREALIYLTDALQMHVEVNFIYGISEVHRKLGILYLNENEIEQASYHIRKSMSLGVEVTDIHGLTHNLIIYGKILRLSNKIDEATFKVEEGLALARKHNLKQFELLAYEELKELKQLQNQPYEALTFFNKFTSLKDSLFNLEKSKQIAYLEFENELKKKDLELIEYRSQKKASTLINLALIFGIVILSIAGVAIYFVFKQRVKKDKQLEKKNNEFLESNQKLIQKELENSELKRKELNQQLDFKNRELTAYALNFIKKNEVVKELEHTMNEIKRSPSIEKDKLIFDLKNILRKNLSIDKDWEDFSRFFDDVHRGFYASLKEKCEGLTANDLKLCSLIRLNLSVKETASILGISPESAKTSRYRLRKKLGLNAQEEISNYLFKVEKG